MSDDLIWALSVIGVFLAVWIGFAVLIGRYAKSKGLDELPFMLCSVLLSPMIALLIVACFSPRLRPEDAKRCPSCAESIRREAVKCRFCGSQINLSSSARA
jgi:hypothetical protein